MDQLTLISFDVFYPRPRSLDLGTRGPDIIARSLVDPVKEELIPSEIKRRLLSHLADSGDLNAGVENTKVTPSLRSSTKATRTSRRAPSLLLDSYHAVRSSRSQSFQVCHNYTSIPIPRNINLLDRRSIAILCLK